MKLTRNLSRVSAVALVALSSATLNAGSFVYEAVPYELTDINTGELYTIGGTFTTDCNDCSLRRKDVVSIDVSVEGPFPFNFTLDNIDPNIGLFGVVSPTDISIPNSFLLLTVNNPSNNLIWQNFSGHTVQYSNDNTTARFLDPSTDDLIIATFVPEPSSFALGVFGLLLIRLRQFRG